jgi:hypothetical protein
VRSAGICCFAYGPQLQDIAAAFVEARHQEDTGVDDAPGQVAAERADQHGADLDIVCGQDAQCEGKGEGHDQAKQHLRDSVDRIEDTIVQQAGEAGLSLRPSFGSFVSMSIPRFGNIHCSLQESTSHQDCPPSRGPSAR